MTSEEATVMKGVETDDELIDEIIKSYIRHRFQIIKKHMGLSLDFLTDLEKNTESWIETNIDKGIMRKKTKIVDVRNETFVNKTSFVMREKFSYAIQKEETMDYWNDIYKDEILKKTIDEYVDEYGEQAESLIYTPEHLKKSKEEEFKKNHPVISFYRKVGELQKKHGIRKAFETPELKF